MNPSSKTFIEQRDLPAKSIQMILIVLGQQQFSVERRKGDSHD